MLLQEYQVKRLISAHGVPIPPGQLIESPEEATVVARQLKTHIILKGQSNTPIPMQHGLYRQADSPHDAGIVASTLLDKSVDGLRIRRILVEPALAIARLFVLSFSLDEQTRAMHLSADELAKYEPYLLPKGEMAFNTRIRPEAGPQDYHIWEMMNVLAIDRESFDPIARLIKALYDVCEDIGALSLTCHPLGLLTDGRWMVMDARATVDDACIQRKKPLFSLAEELMDSKLARGAADIPATFTRFEGDIACIANGWGNSMALLDGLAMAGLTPASVITLHEELTADRMESALELAFATYDAKAVCLNLMAMLGQGDPLIEVILRKTGELSPGIPLIARIVTPKMPTFPQLPADSPVCFTDTLTSAIGLLSRHASGGKKEA